MGRCGYYNSYFKSIKLIDGSLYDILTCEEGNVEMAEEESNRRVLVNALLKMFIPRIQKI